MTRTVDDFIDADELPKEHELSESEDEDDLSKS